MTTLPPRNANLRMEVLRRGAVVEPVDLLAEDGAHSQGLLYRKGDGAARIGVHLMHPRTDQCRNYNIPKLVEAGCLVLGRSSRSVNNDTDTVHEELLLDVAAGVALLRQRGAEQVVLVGNSGGAPLAATRPRRPRTPQRAAALTDRSPASICAPLPCPRRRFRQYRWPPG